MPDSLPLVLVVEDQDEMRKYVEHVLQARGYATVGASNGLEALSMVERQMPDLIIMDLMMPYMDGMTTCREIRRTSQCPIIVLSALSDEQRKVAAFEVGADDYLTKPFGPAELLARVKAVLRRANQGANAEPPTSVMRFRGVEIDLDGNRASRDGQPLRLTRTEWGLLRVLAQNLGKVVTHRTLLQQVWGPEYGQETEYLHVYMGRLRRKLEDAPSSPRYLLTEPGLGYRLITD